MKGRGAKGRPDGMRRAGIVAVLSFCMLVGAGAASAQSDAGEPYLDSRERAAQDWEVMSQSASSLWEETSETLAPAFANPVTAVLALSAALLGGLFGAWARGAPSRPDRPAPPPEASARGRGGRREERSEGGLIFRSEDPRAESREASLPKAPKKPDAYSGEAKRLFRFFEERFGLKEKSAAAAIEFFNKLSRSIDALRRRAEDAEAERDRLSAELGAAPAAAAAAATESDAPEASAWRMISEGMRLCRSVLQKHHGADPELQRFENVVEMEETLLGLAELRAAALHSGRGVDPGVINQAWPHALFRAEALLQTYYPGQGAWGDLRESVSLMASALRRLLRTEGVTVASATLLAPFAPEDGERWSDAAEDLTELEMVRERLRGAVQRERQPFVIDCESFGYRDANRRLTTRSRLILLDPEEWE